jgi:hypothetical protein
MKAKLTPFPRGASEGLLTLRMDCEGAFDPDTAANLLASRRTSGTWAVWLVADGCWTDPELSDFVNSETSVNWITLRELGDEDWPAAQMPTVLDASAVVARSETARDLMGALAGVAHIPRSIDVVVDVRRPTVDVEQLDMISRACAPMHGLFVYASDDWYQGMVRVAGHASALWSVRRLR